MKKVKLGEVCEVLNGFAFKSLLYVNEGIRIIRITNVQKGYIEDSDPKYYPIEYRNSIEKYILKENDLLMSLTGNVGRVGLISKTMLPAALNQRVACLRTIDSLISKEYVFQFLNSDLFEQLAIRSSNGVAQKNLSTDWLKKVEITYPSVEQQKLITSTLNLIERLICCRKEQNKKLNELVKSRFNEMFGGNKQFESIDNLFDIIDGDRGKNYPKSDELFDEEYCLFLNTKNVTKNGFSFITNQFITETKDKLLRKGKLERYDIVLTTRGTVGNVAYYDESIKYKHLRINSGMVILRPKKPNLNQKFIIHVLRNNNYSRMISGSAQPQLPITKLKKILLPLPPLSLQNEFADFVAQVDKSQLAIQKSLEELETLKKSLMQEYFG